MDKNGRRRAKMGENGCAVNWTELDWVDLAESTSGLGWAWLGSVDIDVNRQTLAWVGGQANRFRLGGYKHGQVDVDTGKLVGWTGIGHTCTRPVGSAGHRKFPTAARLWSPQVGVDGLGDEEDAWGSGQWSPVPIGRRTTGKWLKSQPGVGGVAGGNFGSDGWWGWSQNAVLRMGRVAEVRIDDGWLENGVKEKVWVLTAFISMAEVGAGLKEKISARGIDLGGRPR